jgi:hypothetical protein
MFVAGGHAHLGSTLLVRSASQYGSYCVVLRLRYPSGNILGQDTLRAVHWSSTRTAGCGRVPFCAVALRGIGKGRPTTLIESLGRVPKGRSIGRGPEGSRVSLKHAAAVCYVRGNVRRQRAATTLRSVVDGDTVTRGRIDLDLGALGCDERCSVGMRTVSGYRAHFRLVRSRLTLGDKKFPVFLVAALAVKTERLCPAGGLVVGTGSERYSGDA